MSFLIISTLLRYDSSFEVGNSSATQPGGQNLSIDLIILLQQEKQLVRDIKISRSLIMNILYIEHASTFRLMYRKI